jgi:hypothetical protein
MSKGAISAFAAFFILLASPVSAAEISYKCPQRIASNDSNQISIYTLNIIEQIYRKLGCATEFVSLPLKRGIFYFNSGKVDGEVLRAELAEKYYKVPFARSTVPIFTLTNAVWSHPDASIQAQRPIGYVLGIVWHEAYIKGKKGKKFHSEAEMYDAYNQGNLGGFLDSDFIAKKEIRENQITPAPVRTEIIEELPVYHYTHKEFADFMAAFSHYIEAQHPFNQLDH